MAPYLLAPPTEANLYQIGVDIGGTFTDLVLWDDAVDAVWVHKLPSTPADPSTAAVAGIVALCAQAGVAPEAVGRVLHGTTVATNIVIERSGAAVGLITTEGFRDVTYIARKKRPLNFSNYQEVPWQAHPLVKRRHRLTVPERVGADGAVLVALDEAEARAAARELRTAGVEAVAICFLFAFLEPAHEKRVKEIVAEEFPEAYVSTSHEVVPLYREYERFATTCLNAFVGPKVGRYFDRFAQALRAHGIRGELHLMTSAGGVVTAAGAAEKPVSLLLSGPVAGLISGIATGAAAGSPSVITLDVGGTSADIGVAPDGELRERHLMDTRVRDYDVMLPMADIDTIGAGGGSIAYVDAGGMFRVGPRSAGALPGPACYGRGGTEPTVTDAMAALGWLRPESLRHGFTLDVARAREAIAGHVAGRLGLSVEDAAAGILRIVTQNMVDAIATNSIRKGLDPRDFALVALGGAGPLFVAAIARELAIPRAIVPPHPGVGAAMGLLCTDVAYNFQATVWENLAAPDRARIAAAYAELGALARERLRADGFADADIELRWKAACRYVGQGYELAVDVPVADAAAEVSGDWIAGLVAGFHQTHERTFFRHFPDKPVHLVNIALAGVGRSARRFRPRPAHAAASPEPDATRPALFPDNGTVARYDTAFVQRSRLAPGAQVDGPAIVEQLDATTVLPPGARATVDAFGNLVIEPGK